MAPRFFDLGHPARRLVQAVASLPPCGADAAFLGHILGRKAETMPAQLLRLSRQGALSNDGLRWVMADPELAAAAVSELEAHGLASIRGSAVRALRLRIR